MEVRYYIRPWGHYIDHVRSEELVCKTIVVKPTHRTSLQLHHLRVEFWYVVSGIGQVQINNDLFEVKPGDKFIIDKEIVHQIINTGQIDLVIYEMQCGMCSENDIERIQDPYDRKNSCNSLSPSMITSNISPN